MHQVQREQKNFVYKSYKTELEYNVEIWLTRKYSYDGDRWEDKFHVEGLEHNG